MKRLTLMVTLCLCLPSFAQDATTAWRNVLQKCAHSDLIGKQSLFFGVSNLIGPGSVWRRADDKSIRLISVLSDEIPSASDQALIIKSNNTAACVGDSSSKWNVKLGLPFSTGATPLTLDIGAVLGGAHDITVSVKGYAVDALDEDQWKKAVAALGPTNVFYKDLQQPNRLLAENAVKVTGLTAVFNFSHDLSADVQAQYKGKAFTLGNSSAATQGKTSTSGGGGATTDSKAGSTATSSSASSSTTTGSPGGSSGGSGGACDSSSATPKDSASAAASTTASTGSNTATFHVDVSGSRRITICVDGPFYLIAAYSNIVNGAPLGIAPTSSSIQLMDASLPAGAVAASDRTPVTTSH